MNNKDEQFMKEALNEAEKSLTEGNWPIGCVIVLDNKIISRAHGQTYSKQNRLLHAEMQALQKVQKKYYDKLENAILYTTYEPCPMCFGAIILSRIKRVVAGVDLDNSGAMYFKEHLPLLFKQEKFKVDFTAGVLSKECKAVFMQSELTKKLIDNKLLKLE